MMRLWGVMIVVLIVPGYGFAHDLAVECKVVGDAVHVEVYFDDGTDAAGAKLRVTAGGKTIAEGTADEKGQWSFLKPEGEYVIEADAGAGHRARKRFGVEITAPRDEDSRAKFTRFRGRELAMGLAIIAALSAVAWALLRYRTPGQGGDSKA